MKRMKVTVEISGQDKVEGEMSADGKWQVAATGCREFLTELKRLSVINPDPRLWPESIGKKGHYQLVLKEFILKCRGEWNPPFVDAEICHCRMVPTENVNRSIINGAHSTDRVSRETSASTACGTCRADVQRLIDYRLNRQV